MLVKSNFSNRNKHSIEFKNVSRTHTTMSPNIPKITAFLLLLLPISALSTPTPPDCSTLVISLADCLSFVSIGSTEKKPQGSCCSGLKTVLKTNAECLCEAFKNSAQFGMELNDTKAMTMPSLCHLSAPNITNCEVDAVTGAAPAPSPTASSPTPIAGGPTTTGGASSDTAPTGSPGSSSSPAVSVFSAPLILSMLVAIFVSILRLF